MRVSRPWMEWMGPTNLPGSYGGCQRGCRAGLKWRVFCSVWDCWFLSTSWSVQFLQWVLYAIVSIKAGVVIELEVDTYQPTAKCLKLHFFNKALSSSWGLPSCVHIGSLVWVGDARRSRSKRRFVDLTAGWRELFKSNKLTDERWCLFVAFFLALLCFQVAGCCVRKNNQWKFTDIWLQNFLFLAAKERLQNLNQSTNIWIWLKLESWARTRLGNYLKLSLFFGHPWS